MIHIDELHLKIPGVSKEEARQLGKDVAYRIAERLPNHVTSLRLDSLDVKINAAPGTSRESMTTMIVDAILKKLC